LLEGGSFNFFTGGVAADNGNRLGRKRKRGMKKKEEGEKSGGGSLLFFF